MTTRQASCSCGQLEVTVSGEPVRISMCHCRACQRRTGSPFGVQARYAESDVEVNGQSQAWRRIADSGHSITFHFCPNCGSTVFYRPEQEPEIIAVAVGGFADPGFPPPTVSVYESRRHPWVATPPDARRFD